jgi:hypothetical protein
MTCFPANDVCIGSARRTELARKSKMPRGQNLLKPTSGFHRNLFRCLSRVLDIVVGEKGLFSKGL